MKGKLITLEGIEGCGKSLQAEMLEREFQRLGIPALLTRQPGGTPFGMEVRRILLSRDGAERRPISELLLYLADRYQSLQEVIEPALRAGRHVLCDRYHDATRVYQGYTRGIPFETIDRLAEVLDIRTPDRTLVLAIDLETGLKRAQEREAASANAQWSRFEGESREFHRKVEEGYGILRDREPSRIRFVDASGTPEQVFRRIWTTLAEPGWPFHGQDRGEEQEGS